MIRRPKPVLGMVLKGYPRISETFISNEILFLERLGFRIHIFSMRQPREAFSHDSVRRIRAGVDYLPETLVAGISRFLIPNLRLMARTPRVYADAARMAWRRWLRTRKSATLKHLLQAGYLVSKLPADGRIVHLHAHFAHSPASVAFFSSLLGNLPFSFTAHAKDIYTSDPRQLREKIAHARFVVTCTEYNRTHLRRLAGDTATPIHRVYHGIDLNLFTNGRTSPETRPPYSLLTIARMVPKKGLPTVYHALKRLRDDGLAFTHTLVGDGEERDKVLALIRRLKLADVCQWLGTLPHEAVLGHFRAADLFVLGCRVAGNGDRDGIPNVFAESMAMGVPVVATRVSAIPELIQDGISGLLVPPERPEALAAAVSRLLTDIPFRERVMRNGRTQVAAVFDNRRLIRELAAIYLHGQPRLNPCGSLFTPRSSP